MKKLFTAFALLCMLLKANDASAQQKLSAKDFGWLVGSWVITDNEYITTEYWKTANDSCLTGAGYVMKGSDTIVKELLRLERIGNHWVYIAQVNENPPVLFTLSKARTARSAVFQNYEHDFPQKIKYTFVSEKEITAETSGTQNGTESKEEYRFKKVK